MFLFGLIISLIPSLFLELKRAGVEFITDEKVPLN